MSSSKLLKTGCPPANDHHFGCPPDNFPLNIILFKETNYSVYLKKKTKVYIGITEMLMFPIFLLANVSVRCNGVWVRIHLGTGFPIVSSTYISYSNLHEHERFKDLLSNGHIIVHIHFRIVYFALHHG